MLITVKDASQKLNVTTRMIQIRCKKSNVKKIGNQYQITNDILNSWLNADAIKSETKVETKKETSQISHPKQKNIRFATSQVILFILMFILSIVLYLFYNSLTTEIGYLKNENIKDSKTYKYELKTIQKRLNDATDVINNQQLEIQYLKIKDSVRTRPKW